MACERSGAYDVHERQQTPVVPFRTTQVPVNYGQQIQQYSWLERLKEIVHNTALISAVVYAIYMFYQVSMAVLINFRVLEITSKSYITSKCHNDR